MVELAWFTLRCGLWCFVLFPVYLVLLTLHFDILSISYEIALKEIATEPLDEMSTLVQVMAWCRQAASHYSYQCWLWSLWRNMASLGHNELKSAYPVRANGIDRCSTHNNRTHNFIWCIFLFHQMMKLKLVSFPSMHAVSVRIDNNT